MRYRPGMKDLLPALAAALLALPGCPAPVEPKPAPIPKDTDMCLAAEQGLERMQCLDRAGDPMWVNRNGERFRQICENAQLEGRVFLNPRCVADAATCDAAKKCPVIE